MPIYTDVTDVDPIKEGTITIYKGRNCPYRIRLMLKNRPLTLAQMQAITKITFLYNNEETSNSIDHSEYWDLTTYAANAQVSFDFGLINFTAGTDAEAEFIVYSPEWPLGRIFGTIAVEISEDALSTASLIDPLKELTLSDLVGMTADMVTNIELMASPGNWKLFYSNGSGMLQELAMNSAGYLRIKNGEAPVIETEASLNITTDYNMVTADLYRKSIRLLAATDKNVYLPTGSSAIDGKRVTLIQGSTGRVIANAAAGNFVVATGETQLISGSLFAASTLEYVHEILTWVGISGLGKWGTP